MSSETYKKAGVDINKADEFVRRIKTLINKTQRPGTLGKFGGFSGFFQPPLKRMKNPVLVSSTDGVGTKLLLADLLQKYDTVGIDLVAMSVNDVVVTGAEPLFFLDYIACGKLDNVKLHALMRGIVKGCQEAGCALIGGETAELPGMYEKGKGDLAGFCVGIVEQNRIIDGSLCKKGDRVVGLASSGFHSNGFSLVRKIFSADELKGKLGYKLLKPTRIYVQPLVQVMKKFRVKAAAHITGGGFIDNIPRVLPRGLSVRIEKGSWPVPVLFRKLQEKGGVREKEMLRVFNMGIGMVLVLPPRSAHQAIEFLEGLGEKAWIIGELTPGKGEVIYS